MDQSGYVAVSSTLAKSALFYGARKNMTSSNEPDCRLGRPFHYSAPESLSDFSELGNSYVAPTDAEACDLKYRIGLLVFSAGNESNAGCGESYVGKSNE